MPVIDLQKLSEAARAVGIDPDAELERRFARYFELIESANSHFNLTGARGWDRVRDELFIRSLRLLAPVAGGDVSAVEWFAGRRVLDVGTGAGIPGLILKLAVPDASVTLLDSSRKKTAFLREVVADLALQDVSVVTGRAEEVARDPDHREAYDLVVSRGVARLVELAELTLPFAKMGGAVVAVKGREISAEVLESEEAARLLGAAPALTSTVSAPGAMQPDTMIYWMKIGETPSDYPRRNGLPHARPLTSAAIATLSRDSARTR